MYPFPYLATKGVINAAFHSSYAVMQLVGSSANPRQFQCSRENCYFEGNLQAILNHGRQQHPRLGCNLLTCALPPCKGVALRSVADLVQHLRQTHDQLLMSEGQRSGGDPKVPRLRIILPRPDQPNPTIANGSNSAAANKTPSESSTSTVASTMQAVQPSGDNADSPNETFVCGACGVESTEVALMTCHQQHAHLYRMPIHCNKCGVPMPQLWTVLQAHYDKGHMASNMSNLLPFIYRRSVYFQVSGLYASTL